jgi:hypothetical protein
VLVALLGASEACRFLSHQKPVAKLLNRRRYKLQQARFENISCRLLHRVQSPSHKPDSLQSRPLNAVSLHLSVRQSQIQKFNSTMIFFTSATLLC